MLERTQIIPRDAHIPNSATKVANDVGETWSECLGTLLRKVANGRIDAQGERSLQVMQSLIAYYGTPELQRDFALSLPGLNLIYKGPKSLESVVLQEPSREVYDFVSAHLEQTLRVRQVVGLSA